MPRGVLQGAPRPSPTSIFSSMSCLAWSICWGEPRMMKSLKLGSPLGGSWRLISTKAPVCWLMALTFSPPARGGGTGGQRGGARAAGGEGGRRAIRDAGGRGGFQGGLTSADDQPALVGGDGEGHFAPGGAPTALASPAPAAPRGHPWPGGSRGAALRGEEVSRAGAGGNQPPPTTPSVLESTPAGWGSPLGFGVPPPPASVQGAPLEFGGAFPRVLLTPSGSQVPPPRVQGATPRVWG